MEFSIIIPIYNTAKYLNECLGSLTRQTFKDYELILVDDGSTDDSGKLCDDFASEFEGECQVIHKENGGLSSARNAGLDIARGEWIVFVDSDDYVSVELLEVLDCAIKEYGADQYMYNMRRFDNEGNLGEKVIYTPDNIRTQFRTEEELGRHIIKNVVIYKDGWEACNRIYRRSIIEENHIRFVDNKKVFAEDMCFTLEYMLHIGSIYKMCNILYFYRITPGSLMNQAAQDTMLKKLYTLSEYIYEKYKNSNKFLTKHYHDFFERLIYFHIKHKLTDISDEEINEQIAWIKRNTKYGKKWALLPQQARTEIIYRNLEEYE